MSTTIDAQTLQAYRELVAILDALDDETRTRVISRMVEKYLRDPVYRTCLSGQGGKR